MSTSVVTAAPTTDHRGSWVPTWTMITTRLMELRKRRGLMIAMAVVNIGVPSIFLIIRLIAHAVAPKSYGPAGGYDIFSAMVAGVMFIFGFIVAATLGASAGSNDLTDGMFRHLVVTGRSRLAIFFARIPAGLAIVVSMVAAGFTIVCAVCCFAAPTQLSYNGVNVPANLTHQGFVTWAVDHPKTVICNFSYRDVNVFLPCGGRNGVTIRGGSGPGTQVTPPPTSSHAQQITAARKIANEDYADYSKVFLAPPISLMIQSGLWIELEAIIGFMVGLGLASVIGTRTVPTVLMIVFEVIITPIFARNTIPHLINVQRGLVGLATAHIEPSALPRVFGGGGNDPVSRLLVPETLTVAWLVIAAWLIGWTALGAWRMARRDA